MDTAEADIAAVTEMLRRAFNAADVEGVMAIWDMDGVLMPPGHPSVSGHAAIRAYFSKLFERASLRFEFGSSERSIRAGLAVERLEYSASVHSRQGGPVRTDHGKGVHIYRQQPDGGWTLVMDIWNSDSSS